MDTFISSKGGLLLVNGGFVFRVDRQNVNTGEVSWRCSQRLCRARAKSTGPGDDHDVVTAWIGEHTHPGDPAKVEMQKAYSTMKHVAEVGDQPNLAILATHSAQMSAEAIAAFPTAQTASRVLRRKKQLKADPEPIPQTMVDLQITAERATLTLGGEDFNVVLHDTGPNDPNRIIGGSM